MITKCANPSCENSFHYFRGGNLFLVEPRKLRRVHDTDFHDDSRRSEYFWLCEKCAPAMTIHLDQDGHSSVKLRNEDQLRAS
jgi:hypothetical protein